MGRRSTLTVFAAALVVCAPGAVWLVRSRSAGRETSDEETDERRAILRPYDRPSRVTAWNNHGPAQR